MVSTHELHIVHGKGDRALCNLVRQVLIAFKQVCYFKFENAVCGVTLLTILEWVAGSKPQNKLCSVAFLAGYGNGAVVQLHNLPAQG